MLLAIPKKYRVTRGGRSVQAVLASHQLDSMVALDGALWRLYRDPPLSITAGLILQAESTSHNASPEPVFPASGGSWCIRIRGRAPLLSRCVVSETPGGLARCHPESQSSKNAGFEPKGRFVPSMRGRQTIAEPRTSPDLINDVLRSTQARGCTTFRTENCKSTTFIHPNRGCSSVCVCNQDRLLGA